MDDRETTLRHWLAAHRGILVRISRAYAAGPDDEEDLFQDILLALWRSVPAFRGDSKASTWVYQVALHVALSRRRDRRRRAEPSPLELAPEPSRDGQADADQRLRWATVLDAVRRLPSLDRAVLLLALEGASQHDIAQVLGTTAGHAGVKLHRARRKLSQLLEN